MLLSQLLSPQLAARWIACPPLSRTSCAARNGNRYHSLLLIPRRRSSCLDDHVIFILVYYCRYSTVNLDTVVQKMIRFATINVLNDTARYGRHSITKTGGTVVVPRDSGPGGVEIRGGPLFPCIRVELETRRTHDCWTLIP